MNRLLTTTQARANLYRLIDQVAQSHDPILITGKQNNAVLVSQEDWESIQETIYLLSIPGVGISIKEGLQSSIDDCDEDLEW
jgi:antitoxin YefM